MTNTSDLLASESLLFTVLGVVFSLWYPEISNALNTTWSPAHPQDNDLPRAVVSSALRLKALPLASANVMVVAIFLPDTIRVIANAIRDFYNSGLQAFADYDAVRAALCVVTLFAAALAVYLVTLASELRALRAKMGTNKRQAE